MATELTLESSLEFIANQSVKKLKAYKGQLERRLAVVNATLSDVVGNGKKISGGVTGGISGVGGAKTQSTGVGNHKNAKAKKASAKAVYKDLPDSATLKKIIDEHGADGRINRKAANAAGYSIPSAIKVAKLDNSTFGAKRIGTAHGEVWLKK